MSPTARIYLRPHAGVVQSYWTWDLVSAEGQSVESSGPFSTCEECREDAARLGLPVSTHGSPRSTRSWTICRDNAGTAWRWECVEDSGALLSRSRQAFHTVRECVGNARQAGCVSRIRFD